VFPSRKSNVAQLTCIFTRFPRFTASFSVDSTSNLASSLFPYGAWLAWSHLGRRVVASSVCVKSCRSDRRVAELRRVPWRYLVPRRIYPTSSLPPFSPMYRCKLQVLHSLLVFLPSPERQGNNGRADARSLRVSERKDACIMLCQGFKSWRDVAATRHHHHTYARIAFFPPPRSRADETKRRNH